MISSAPSVATKPPASAITTCVGGHCCDVRSFSTSLMDSLRFPDRLHRSFLRAISCRVCKIPYERENQFYSKPRGGVAQQDEWLIPCDGLLFLNDINLENAFLDATFQVLKGTARGLVQIGVAKPHPVSLNESATNGAPELQASFPPHH